MKFKLSDTAYNNSEKLSIGDLWKELDFFVKNRVVDNELYKGEYPLETRIHQFESLKCLVNEIQKFHEYAASQKS